MRQILRLIYSRGCHACFVHKSKGLLMPKCTVHQKKMTNICERTLVYLEEMMLKLELYIFIKLLITAWSVLKSYNTVSSTTEWVPVQGPEISSAEKAMYKKYLLILPFTHLCLLKLSEGFITVLQFQILKTVEYVLRTASMKKVTAKITN